jgi:HEAT repeat protein
LDNKEAKKLLNDFVSFGSPEDRTVAAEVLVKNGADPKPLAARMFEALNPAKPLVPYQAREGDARMARLIAKHDPSKAETLAKLFAPVIGQTYFDMRLRAEAVELLADFSPPEVAVPVLIAGFGTYTPMVTAATLRALAKIGAPAVPELKKALTAERAGIRYLAAQALAQIGPAARAALPALKAASRDAQPFVARAATAALARIEAK